jgi:RNA polymerase sigma factor (sigma-70 family)
MIELEIPKEIECVMPMIHSLVNKDYRFNARIGREDLIQVGITAAMMALPDFDASRGTKFSSYAFPIIRNAIMKEWQGIMNEVSGGTPYHINNTDGAKDEIEFHNRNTISLNSSTRMIEDLPSTAKPSNIKHGTNMVSLAGESGVDGPYDTLEREEAKEQLRTIMDELDDDAREIMYRHTDGETFAEIARDKDMPQHTVARTYHKSRLILKGKCEEVGLDQYA